MSFSTVEIRQIIEGKLVDLGYEAANVQVMKDGRSRHVFS